MGCFYPGDARPGRFKTHGAAKKVKLRAQRELIINKSTQVNRSAAGLSFWVKPVITKAKIYRQLHPKRFLPLLGSLFALGFRGGWEHRLRFVGDRVLLLMQRVFFLPPLTDKALKTLL